MILSFGLGGQVGLESEVRRGSTFWFSVPLAQPESVEEPAQIFRAELAGVRVLVVDDNQTNRTILERQLSSRGMHAVSASDPASALALLRAGHATSHPFGLALLDLQMPGVDGLQLAAQIKWIAALTHLPIVKRTSVRTHRLEAAFRESGITAALTKPVRQPQLLAR